MFQEACKESVASLMKKIQHTFGILPLRVQEKPTEVELKPLEKVYQGNISKKTPESNTNSGTTNSPTTGGSNYSGIPEEHPQKPVDVIDC